MKTNKINLSDKRKFIKEIYVETDMKILKTINAIAVKAANDPLAKFDDLIRIISDEGTLFQALGNISGKKKGYDPRNIP